ncbi:MAG TPA: DJ-1/PfpI family protein [Chryseolinea sp.]
MIKIGMIVFDGMTQLDLTGPLEVFSRFPDTRIHVLSKNANPIRCDRALTLIPDTTFKNCIERLDVLFVPGGPGISDILNDEEYMTFIKSKGDSKYITSVCTGSVVLAACGLLSGFKATTHWLSIDILKRFGIEVMSERVVVDRNRITGGGVTSGIDFALTIASILFGEARAKEIQLMIEYNPNPPFRSGHPDTAEESIVEAVTAARKEIQKKRLAEIDKYILAHHIGQ